MLITPSRRELKITKGPEEKEESNSNLSIGGDSESGGPIARRIFFSFFVSSYSTSSLFFSLFLFPLLSYPLFSLFPFLFLMQLWASRPTTIGPKIGPLPANPLANGPAHLAYTQWDDRSIGQTHEQPAHLLYYTYFLIMLPSNKVSKIQIRYLKSKKIIN